VLRRRSGDLTRRFDSGPASKARGLRRFERGHEMERWLRLSRTGFTGAGAGAGAGGADSRSRSSSSVCSDNVFSFFVLLVFYPGRSAPSVVKSVFVVVKIFLVTAVRPSSSLAILSFHIVPLFPWTISVDSGQRGAFQSLKTDVRLESLTCEETTVIRLLALSHQWDTSPYITLLPSYIKVRPIHSATIIVN
jgi:hypothetical protein